VFVQETEGADAVDGVWAVEEFYFRAITNADAVVETAHAGVFVRHPFIRGHAVIVSALDMKGRGAINAAISA
jgi:hypothetical protein